MTGPGRCVVVGGAGAVGAMMADWLSAAGGDVVAVDPAGGTEVRCGDVVEPDTGLSAELGAADVVVLAVPEPVAVAALPVLVSSLRPDALLVDTLSVKGPYVEAVRRAGAAAAGLQTMGLNPMFAPSLEARGRPVAEVTVVDGPRARRMRELVADVGARVVRVGADEHDRLAAASQALTHATVLAFGLALGELDVDVDRLAEIAPPPHATMLGLLARITSGAPAVYHDVQAANPAAEAARRALADGADELVAMFDDPDATGDLEAFGALLDGLGEVLGPQLEPYRELCARTFAATADER